MSTLIVLLPPAPRLPASQAEPSAAPVAPDMAYALSTDGQHLAREGRAPGAELPAAGRLVAVLPASAVAWHRITAPKAPAGRLRQALASVMEDGLLEDEAELHLALPPQWQAGELTWVAVVKREWLRACLTELEAGGRTVDAVVPGWLPEGPAAAAVLREHEQLQLAWRDAAGPLCLPLASPMARKLVAEADPAVRVAWQACPEGAAQAAELAGEAVASHSSGEWLVAAASSPWNLRQFDLGVRRAGQRAVREALRQLVDEPRWRPLRWGLLALVLVQLVGANLWAWQARSHLASQKQAMTARLQNTFPQVRAVFDPPAQMQKEMELLRAAAGRPGDSDLEPLLAAADAAWPSSRGPAQSLRFDNGRLTLASPGWSAAETDAFRQALRPMGLVADNTAAGITLRAARPGERTVSTPSPSP